MKRVRTILVLLLSLTLLTLVTLFATEAGGRVRGAFVLSPGGHFALVACQRFAADVYLRRFELGDGAEQPWMCQTFSASAKEFGNLREDNVWSKSRIVDFAGIEIVPHRAIGSVPSTMANHVLVRVPYWLIASLGLLPLVLFARRAWRTHARRCRGLCVNCGYDLRASEGRCPECGRFSGKGAIENMIAKPV